MPLVDPSQITPVDAMEMNSKVSANFIKYTKYLDMILFKEFWLKLLILMYINL